jgi:hypothetical protein
MTARTRTSRSVLLRPRLRWPASPTRPRAEGAWASRRGILRGPSSRWSRATGRRRAGLARRASPCRGDNCGPCGTKRPALRVGLAPWTPPSSGRPGIVPAWRSTRCFLAQRRRPPAEPRGWSSNGATSGPQPRFRNIGRMGPAWRGYRESRRVARASTGQRNGRLPALSPSPAWRWESLGPGFCRTKQPAHAHHQHRRHRPQFQMGGAVSLAELMDVRAAGARHHNEGPLGTKPPASKQCRGRHVLVHVDDDSSDGCAFQRSGQRHHQVDIRADRLTCQLSGEVGIFCRQQDGQGAHDSKACKKITMGRRLEMRLEFRSRMGDARPKRLEGDPPSAG